MVVCSVRLAAIVPVGTVVTHIDDSSCNRLSLADSEG